MNCYKRRADRAANPVRIDHERGFLARGVGVLLPSKRVEAGGQHPPASTIDTMSAEHPEGPGESAGPAAAVT